MSLGLGAIYLALILLALAFLTARRSGRARRAALVPVRPARPHALYHIPGPDPARPLRIGITVNPRRREGQYRREAWWWYRRTGPLTVRRWYPSEAAARVAEAAAIRREAPEHNDHHNLGRGHVLAARRMGSRHVPDVEPVRPGAQLPGPAGVRRVRAAGRRTISGRGGQPRRSGVRADAGTVPGSFGRGRGGRVVDAWE